MPPRRAAESERGNKKRSAPEEDLGSTSSDSDAPPAPAPLPKRKANKGRGRRAEEPDAAGAADVNGGGAAPPALPAEAADGAAAASSNANRREAWAKIAATRAAHFARADKNDRIRKTNAATTPMGQFRNRAGAGGGSSGGGASSSAGAGAAEGEEDAATPPKELWPGPFATARQLMNAREAAAAAREERILNGTATAEPLTDDEEDGLSGPRAPPVPTWVPRGRGSRRALAPPKPTLFALCLDFLAENVESVESLGCVTPNVRTSLAAHLCRRLRLTTATLRRLAEPGMTELVLPDCSRIEPAQMEDTLLLCRAGLQRLRLGTCGRCVGDSQLAALVEAGGLPQLERLELHGCYRLSDKALAPLLAAAPKLRALELPCDSRLGAAGLTALRDSVGARLTHLSVSQCEQMNREALALLPSFPNLESLALSGLPGLTDELLEAALAACGKGLKKLDISDCEQLTDAALAHVWRHCGALAELRLGNNPAFTNGALKALFLAADDEQGQEGLPREGDTAAAAAAAAAEKEEEMTDTPAVPAASAETSTPAQNGGAHNSSSGGGGGTGGGTGGGGGGTGGGNVCVGLTHVSLRGLVELQNDTIAALAAACAGKLRFLDLNGCALVSDAGLAALARDCAATLTEVDLSFCRAVTDNGLGLLLDASPNLEILRMWGCRQISKALWDGHLREELEIVNH